MYNVRQWRAGKPCCSISVTTMMGAAIWYIVMDIVIVAAAIPWVRQCIGSHMFAYLGYQHSCR